MMKNVGRLLVGAAVVVALALLAWGLFRPTKTTVTVASPAAPRMVGLQVGNIAPNFTLLTSNGKRIALSNLRGQPVVLLFLSTGCTNCQTQVTDTQKVYAAQQAAHKPFTLLAVDTQDTASYIMSYDPQTHIAIPVPMNQTSHVDELYQVRGTPVSIFIDREGIIRSIVEGEMDQAQLLRQVTEITL
jgi:cytochrome c biogenesis protein CcmG/thiol:disulfide interchange protein DsbE